MPKQLDRWAPTQDCLFCRQTIKTIEDAAMISGVLVAHERCARVSRVG